MSTSAKSVADKTPAWYSLRWRLPLLMGTLMVVVVTTFLVIAYREVRGNLVRAAGTRAQAAAEQLAGLFIQSTQQRMTELHRSAAQLEVRQLLQDASDEHRQAAKTSLARLLAGGASRVEIWSTDGRLVASWSNSPEAAELLPSGPPPAHAGVGLLQRHKTIVFSETAVDITVKESADDHAISASDRLGYLVVRRALSAAATAEALNRLIAHGASIAVGNKTDGAWTDLVKPIDAPRVDLARTGQAEYRGSDGTRRVGALADIRGTPWAVWVEFSETALLGPARDFLRRMLVIALAFVALAGVAIQLAMARITAPLRELTQASESVATGQYRRVSIDRRDEVGRLSAAFNAMTEQVAEAHRGLEARVRERTASLEETGRLLEQRVRELKETREQLDRFFSLSLDLFCIADHDGRFVRVNPAWQDVLGWTSDDLTAVAYLDFVHPDDRASTLAESARLATGEATSNFENRYRHKDGTYRWLSWKAAVDPQRGLVYAAARDVTEEKRIARDLQQQADELATVNRELEAFSYSVSHDLRAPLRHITGFAMMFQQTAGASLTSEGHRLLKKITDASTHMGRLIDDLLSFSRVGRTQLMRAHVNLNQVARDAQQEVSTDLNGRHVTWQVQPLPTVDGDPALLRLVFVNLLSNALKYSSTRTQAQIEVGTMPDHGAEAIVFVRDNGVGFDMQYADKLFGVFQRLHSADEFEGTGIGLANVRRIVQRHGGRTWAEGRPNEGATFYFSLPSGKDA